MCAGTVYLWSIFHFAMVPRLGWRRDLPASIATLIVGALCVWFVAWYANGVASRSSIGALVVAPFVAMLTAYVAVLAALMIALASAILNNRDVLNFEFGPRERYHRLQTLDLKIGTGWVCPLIRRTKRDLSPENQGTPHVLMGGLTRGAGVGFSGTIRCMDVLDLSRLQFGVTTVYHFLFVPITISLSFLVAGMQTAWVRTNNEKWLRATKFFGKIFLINFAMGVVTGIVQEFQFGMNWSDFSRFVGDIFWCATGRGGAPRVLPRIGVPWALDLWVGSATKEASPRVDLVGLDWHALSAYFILAANSFMQHPTSYTYNPETNRVELTNFFDMLFQSTAKITFFHTISAAFITGGAVVAGISAWLLVRGKSPDVARSTLKVGSWTILVAAVMLMWSGDSQARIMVEQQPMKMAAAEALYETSA